MYTGAERLLSAILDCSYDDLAVLDKVGFYMEDVLRQHILLYGNEPLTFETIFDAVVDMGLSEMAKTIYDKKCSLGEPLSKEEKKELEDIRKLDPDEDFEVYFNYLDTHISCASNYSIYKRYFSAALKKFEDNTGFKIADTSNS